MNAQADVIDNDTDTDNAADTATLEAPIGYDSDQPGAQFAYPPKGEGSKWNALKHGLMAKKLFPPDLAAEIQKYTEMLIEEFKPTNTYEKNLINTMGRAGAQVERARNLMIVNLQRVMDRAVLFWDIDRRGYVDDLAARLQKDTVRVSNALKRTKQGIDWLLENWRGLENALTVNGEAGWTETQRRIAYELMGVRQDYREGCPELRASSTAAEQAELVKKQKKALEEILAKGLRASDTADQLMAQAGMPLEEDAWTKRLRKTTASNLLDYNRARAELLRSRAAAAAAGTGTEAGTAAARPAPGASGDGEGDKAAARATPTAAGSPRGGRTSEPTPRPVPSKAAFEFLLAQSKLLGEDVVAFPQRTATASKTATAARSTGPVTTAAASAGPERATQARPGQHPGDQAGATDPAARPTLSPEDRAQRDRDRESARERRRRRAQEKQARKAARRRGR